MLKMGIAILAVTAVASISPVTFADAKSKTSRDKSADSYRFGGAVQQYDAGALRGRPDPTSYDGRRTGYPRTCGHDFFIYSGRTTAGPYCN
jgi:hypothetical protein